jgi:hypothetical protein
MNATDVDVAWLTALREESDSKILLANGAYVEPRLLVAEIKALRSLRTQALLTLDGILNDQPGAMALAKREIARLRNGGKRGGGLL